MPKEYILQVKVKDDGIGEPLDDAFGEEYVSIREIINEVERVDMKGLVIKVIDMKEVPVKKGKTNA
jgi:hypothetical protein